MYRILIVEDDFVIAKTIQSHLRKWGFEAEYVTDLKDVMAAFDSFDPQLVLMDISLPFFNGYYWCAEIRRRSKVPIIFLSSAGDNMNIVMAMNMGGDDFLTKPFDLSVLTAKVQALLRRTYSFAGQMNVIERDGILLNLGEATLTYGDSKLELTKNDIRILQILMENAGNAVTRDAIMTKLWESDSFVDENTLTVNMTRLRKKLEEIGIRDWIQTKKGIGYLVE